MLKSNNTYHSTSCEEHKLSDTERQDLMSYRFTSGVPLVSHFEKLLKELLGHKLVKPVIKRPLKGKKSGHIRQVAS